MKNFQATLDTVFTSQALRAMGAIKVGNLWYACGLLYEGQKHGSITSILVHQTVAYEASQQIAAAAASLCLVLFQSPLSALTLHSIQCWMWDPWLPNTKALHWLMPGRYVNRMQSYTVSFAVFRGSNSFLATECWKINKCAQCKRLFCSYTITVQKI